MADVTQLSDEELMAIASPVQSMSDDELFALAGQPAPPAPQLRPDYPHPAERAGEVKQIDDAVRAIASGATFGYADEIAARAAAATGVGGQVESEDYDELLAAERARDEAIPAGVKIPGEIAGGVLSTAAAAPLASAKAVQFAAKLPGWLRASGLAGAYGALYGSGTAEEGERLKGAAKGGTTGAILGAAGYPVVKSAQWLGGKVGDAARRRWQEPTAAAKATVAGRAALDELTPGGMKQRLKNLGPQATLYDVGRANVQGLGRHTASVPGPAQNRAQMLLNQRAEGEAARINRAVAKGLDPEDYYAAEEGFLNNLKTKAAPLYKKAYDEFQDVTSKPLQRLLESNTGKKALKEAVEITENERAAGEIVEDLSEGVRSLRSWDQLKRGFDSLLDKSTYRNELTGKLNARGYSVDKMRRRLLAELDKATGGKAGTYATARATYAGDAEAIGALREGRKALNMDPEQITRRLGELSDAGKEAFRSGVARALKDVVSKTPGKGDSAKRIFGTVLKRSQVRAAFPDQESYRMLSKALIAEQRFAQGRAKAITGSMTEPRRAESMDILSEAGKVGGIVAGSNIPGGHPLLMARIYRQVGGALMGKPKAHDLEVAKLLFNRDQRANRSAIDTLFERSVWDGLPESVKQKIGQAMLVGAGQQGAKAGETAEEYIGAP